MEGVEIIFIVIGLMVILWFINESISIEIDSAVKKGDDIRNEPCKLHTWTYHEIDGHMYCTTCKKLPLQEDNGERV